MISPVVQWPVIIVYIASICALICCKLDKLVPVNYILLVVFTFCVSIIVAVTCMRVPNHIVVLEAAVLTAAMVIGLTIYAIRTKTDFTMCGGTLYVLGMVFLTFSLFSFFLGGPDMNLAVACFGVILFSFYLVYDT